MFGFSHGLQFMGAVLIPFFTDWGGLGYKQIMILQAAFLLSTFIFEVPTGVIADRFGRKYSLILATVAIIIGILIYVSYPSFHIFLLGEIFWGLGMALFSGAGDALLYDTLKQLHREKESKKMFINTQNIYLFGLMISAPLGSLIYFVTNDLRMPMFYMVIPQAIALIIGLTFVEPKRFEKIKESYRYLNILKDGVSFFWKHKILKVLAFDMVAIAVIAYLIIVLYQGLLLNLHVDIKYFGVIHFFILAAEILVLSQYRRMEKILKAKKRLIVVSALITGTMFIILGLIQFVPLVLGAIILASGFGLTREPLFANYMNKFISSDKRATVISSINMLKSLILVILNPLVGLMADWSIQYTLLILGIFAIGFAIISNFRIKEKMLID